MNSEWMQGILKDVRGAALYNRGLCDWLVQCFSEMTWHVTHVAQKGDFFLLSDYATVHGKLSDSSPEDEYSERSFRRDACLSFPVSSEVRLYLNFFDEGRRWRYYPMSHAGVVDMNRKTAINASRYLVAPYKVS